MRKGQRVGGDFVQIARGGVVVVVVKAVGVHEVGVLAAKLLRLFVHQLNKLVDVAVADVISEGKRRVVARRHHHRIEKVDRAHLLADVLRKVRGGAFGVLELVENRLLDRNLGVVDVGNVLICHDVGHDLGGGGGIALLVGVLLKNYLTYVAVDKQN